MPWYLPVAVPRRVATSSTIAATSPPPTMKYWVISTNSPGTMVVFSESLNTPINEMAVNGTSSEVLSIGVIESV